MSSSTEDLRAALHAYADDVPLPDAEALIAGAEHKRSHARKVRTAVIAGAAAVLMAVVTVIGIQGIGQEKALTPAQLNKKHHTHFAQYTRGLKLTDIVEVPVRKVADPNNASPATNAVSFTLPDVGSTVYVVCDSSAILAKGGENNADDYVDVQLRGTGNLFSSCGSGGSSLGPAKSGGSHKAWVVTDATPAVSKAPIAVYTPVAWSDYPAMSHRLSPKPQPLTASQPGEFDAHFSGSGDSSVSRTVHVPASMDRGASLLVAPSSTGRFQVLIGGKVQRLDYTGLPASMGGEYGWVPPGKQPEVRDTWLDYWPDSGIETSDEARFAGPEPGSSATITIRAVGTTGPWKAMLAWQKKQ